MTAVNRTLIIVNVLVFLLQPTLGGIGMYLALWPLQSGSPFFPWQLVTYGFLHSGITHLLVNMLALYMFGSDLERLWGPRRYLQLYFTGIVSAGLMQLVFQGASGHAVPTVGASGAVFGLLLGFAMYFPKRIIVPLIPPIPMPAPVFVGLYGALELYLGVTGTQQGVAHFAHLGGMLGAWLLIQFWRGKPPFARGR